MIAARIGVPHRRETPPDARARTDWDADTLRTQIARLAYQTDGGMGGWDLVSGTTTGKATLMTGHMGEVLKAYAKAGATADTQDPIAMIRLQAPFDPLGLLREASCDRMAGAVAAQMAAARLEGATEADLPDIFYLRNRVPNWLGGIRGIKSFERQPVMPLGVPGLQALAFRVTAEERQQERLHFEIIRHLAPELLDLPFAHQSWHPGLPDAPRPTPIVAAANLPLFGNWQYSINGMPSLRAHLTEFFRSTDIELWDFLDRERLIQRLRDTRFDYFGLIGLLGLTAAVFHAARLVRPDKLGAEAGLDHHDSDTLRRPVAPAMRRKVEAVPAGGALSGHLDLISGAATLIGPARLKVTSSGTISLHGWLFAPEWPGAQPAIRARVMARIVGTTSAETQRDDLLAAGIGHGGYGFTLSFDASDLRVGDIVEIESIDGSAPFSGGRLEVVA